MNALHHPAGNFVYVIVLMCKLQINAGERADAYKFA